jgi:hypothetical protein
MKTVLSGIALTAILALAMPTGAYAANMHRSHGKSAHATMSHAKKAHATRGMHAQKMSHKRAGHNYAAHTGSMHRTTTARAGSRNPSDNMANQLNRAENQRLSGGSTPPMTGPNLAPPPGNPNPGYPNMAPMGAPNQPQPIQGL